MNKICEKCDTRCRLGLCGGRTGNFKYCFRRVGSIGGLESTITPFTTLHELYSSCGWLEWIKPESLILDNQPYANDDNMVLLWGVPLDKFGNKGGCPVGYVTVESAANMTQVYYDKE